MSWPQEEDIGDSDDISDFRRVRLMSQNHVRWNVEDSHPFLEISQDGLEVQFSIPLDTRPGDYKGWSARASQALSTYSSRHSFSYFEVEVIAAGLMGYVFSVQAPRCRVSKIWRLTLFLLYSIVCVGFSGPTVPLDFLPGWEPGSWGYHGDDGGAFDGTPYADVRGPTFTNKDIVGCGLYSNRSQGYYTKNGLFLGLVDICSVREKASLTTPPRSFQSQRSRPLHASLSCCWHEGVRSSRRSQLRQETVCVRYWYAQED